MTASEDLQRRLARYYDTDPSLRAPDWVLQAALSTIETTPQRRGLLALRRYPTLSTYTKLAAAAVLVVAVGGFALWQLGSGGPGNPGVSPTPAPSPTAAAVQTASPRPGSTTYVVAPLTSTFTSNLNGLSLSYPAGWESQAATEPWTEGVLPHFGDPDTDVVYDVALEDHLFVGIGSQLLEGRTLEEWQGAFLESEGCGELSRIVVGGEQGLIGTSCDIAIVASGGRGYILGLWSSSDDPQLLELDTRSLFEDVLATVQLHPEDAVE